MLGKLGIQIKKWHSLPAGTTRPPAGLLLDDGPGWVLPPSSRRSIGNEARSLRDYGSGRRMLLEH